MKKKIIIVLAILALSGAGMYLYMYKDHRDIATESADYSTTVSKLQQQFKENSTTANKKYADKTIEVYGKITAADLPNHTITIEEKLSAVFKDSVVKDLPAGKSVKIKGRFVGYDDLLEEFKMDQVSLSQ
jgi:predicted negative regulator of RcsB-dependent stress response